MRRAYEERRAGLLEGLRGQTAVVAPVPKGAFYVFADVAGARAGRELWTLIDEWLSWGVAVLPGTAFGPDYADHVRMSLATRGDQVADAARILRERYATAGGGARGGGGGGRRPGHG